MREDGSALLELGCGRVICSCPLPGDGQGITFDIEGNHCIVQDSGDIIRYKPNEQF